MALYYISLLAIIQGFTEFLPVSSSAHLVLLSKISSAEGHSLELDISVHFGTLLALLIFFYKDVFKLLLGLKENISGNFNTLEAKTFRLLIVATVPVFLVGIILIFTGLVGFIRSIRIIGWSMIVFAILLYIADRYGKTNRKKKEWTLRDAIFIGLWQSIALIPGASRSGTTITGARILGFSRLDSTQLSMILAIPTILGSTSILVPDLITNSYPIAEIRDIVLSTFFSFLAALISLFLLIRYVKKLNFTPFVLYRLLLGLFLLYISSS
tara:strand:- start:23 stop:829 length:807 start_codon:yes stop_codon:yes gene_type:complete